MLITRKINVGAAAVNSKTLNVGDQILVNLGEFGDHWATAQKITDSGVLFMFDDCVAESDRLNGEIEALLIKVHRSFPDELRDRVNDISLPTYGQMFGHDDHYENFEPDNDEQLPLMKIRKNRVADFEDDYEWYWLKNAVKKKVVSAAHFARVSNRGNASYGNALHSRGGRPVFELAD